MAYKVVFKDGEEERMAKAKGLSLPISFKQSVELARALRGKLLSDAYAFLDGVVALRKAVPYKRYVSNIPHRKGKIGPGRFPLKAAKNFKKVLKNAEANAVAKGLDAASLIIYHIAADKASSYFKAGRRRGRRGKSTHVEVVLKEVVIEKKKNKGIQGKSGGRKLNESKAKDKDVSKYEKRDEEGVKKKVGTATKGKERSTERKIFDEEASELANKKKGSDVSFSPASSQQESSKEKSLKGKKELKEETVNEKEAMNKNKDGKKIKMKK